MLKFEQKPKSREIHIIIKEVTRFKSGTFLKALSLAFALHFAGWLLFQITPSYLKSSSTIFPPIEVNIDYIPSIDNGVLADLEKESYSFEKHLFPKISKPKIENPVLSPNELLYLDTETIKSEPFKNLKGFYYVPELINETSKKLNHDNLTIHIFGSLANRPYTFTSSQKTLSEKVSYFVKVEDRSGKIFWMKPTEASSNQKTAKKLLKSLRFQKKPHGFVTEGIVELG